ncbi:MAG: hypothetical protein HY738_05590 [Bacteroidia bacterium]|nr:hypothetical protein [Bacteroidia bacterium]
MKHLKLFFWIFVVFISAFLNSCTKEDLQTGNPLVTNTSELINSDTDSKVAEDILKFIEASESNLKSEKDLSLDSVIYYTEAALNYKYSYTEKSYLDISVETALIEVDYKDGDLVTFGQVNKAQNEMKHKIKEHFDKINNSRKLLHLVDVELLEKDETNKKAKLEMRSLIAYGFPVNWGDFGTTDWWYYGYQMGKCNGYPGGVNSDAAKQIAWRINFSLTPLAVTFFTNPQTIHVIANTNAYLNPNDDIPNNNCNDYLMFYNYEDLNLPPPNPGEEFHNCISPTEMNFYKQGTESVLYMYEANGGPRPAGKTPISISLEGEDLSSGPILNIRHSGNFLYGISNFYPQKMAERRSKEFLKE